MSTSLFGRSWDKDVGKWYVRSRCLKCMRDYAKSYARRLGPKYLLQRRRAKATLKRKDPIKFHIQERLSMWRDKRGRSNLTTAYLLDLWQKQRGRCYYTGYKMVLGAKKFAHGTSASLDKLNPRLGYNIGNVVWASHSANTAKWSRTEKEFYRFCHNVVRRAIKSGKFVP